MRHDGSRLPAFVAVLAVVAGTFAMGLASLVARRIGLRPTLLLSELLLLLPGLLAALAWRLSLLRALGLRQLSANVAWLSLLAGLVFWGGSLGLFELQYAVWAPPAGYLEMFQRLHEALHPSGPFDALLSIGAIAVAPAICEELLFRGLVLGSFRRRLGAPGAVLGAALAFSVIHLDVTAGGLSMYRVPFAFAVGLGLGALCVRAESILAPILAHGLLNTVTFLVAPLTDPAGAQLPDPRPALGAAMLAVALVASVVLLRFVRVDSPADDS